MKFKLDENFGTRTQELFRQSGHEVDTVYNEGIQGCSDLSLFEICLSEDYCLVTMDLDFADVTRFSPSNSRGIAIVRVPQNPSLGLLEHLITEFLRVLSDESIEGHLWIIEVGRIRVHQPDNI